MSDEDKGVPGDRESERNAHIQRNVDFIVEQQARFAAGTERAREGREQRWKQEDERWSRIKEGVRALLKKVQDREKRRQGKGDAGA